MSMAHLLPKVDRIHALFTVKTKEWHRSHLMRNTVIIFVYIFKLQQPQNSIYPSNCTAHSHNKVNNKTAELSQRRLRDAPNIWVPWKVLRVLTTHPATFPEICNGLFFRSILGMCVQNLKFVALPVPEIIGGTSKIGESLDSPTLPILPNF